MRSQSSSQNPANALRAMAAVVSGHYGAERDRAAAIIPRKRFALWPLWSAATTSRSATEQRLICGEIFLPGLFPIPDSYGIIKPSQKRKETAFHDPGNDETDF